MDAQENGSHRAAASRTFRRRSVDLSESELVRAVPAAKDALPLVMQPTSPDVDLAEWGRAHLDVLNAHLIQHGGILFRGFDLPSVAAFERVAGSFYSELYGGYGDLPRVGTSDKIYKSTPYPADKPILFHNESSHLRIWPQKISFFCIQAAESGGETPLLDCRAVLGQLDPALVKRFEEKGLMYVRNFVEGVDVSWQQFFQTSDRAVVEARCANEGVECVWRPDGALRTRFRTRAVSPHPVTGARLFFNQIQLHHIRCLDADVRESLLSLFPEDDLPRHVYFGDGSVIEDSIMDEITELYWRVSVKGPWQNGDLILLDNMRTAHARMPFAGARSIAVAMGEMTDGRATSSHVSDAPIGIAD